MEFEPFANVEDAILVNEVNELIFGRLAELKFFTNEDIPHLYLIPLTSPEGESGFVFDYVIQNIINFMRKQVQEMASEEIGLSDGGEDIGLSSGSEWEDSWSFQNIDPNNETRTKRRSDGSSPKSPSSSSLTSPSRFTNVLDKLCKIVRLQDVVDTIRSDDETLIRMEGLIEEIKHTFDFTSQISHNNNKNLFAAQLQQSSEDNFMTPLSSRKKKKKRKRKSETESQKVDEYFEEEDDYNEFNRSATSKHQSLSLSNDETWDEILGDLTMEPHVVTFDDPISHHKNNNHQNDERQIIIRPLSWKFFESLNVFLRMNCLSLSILFASGGVKATGDDGGKSMKDPFYNQFDIICPHLDADEDAFTQLSKDNFIDNVSIPQDLWINMIAVYSPIPLDDTATMIKKVRQLFFDKTMNIENIVMRWIKNVRNLKDEDNLNESKLSQFVSFFLKNASLIVSHYIFKDYYFEMLFKWDHPEIESAQEFEILIEQTFLDLLRFRVGLYNVFLENQHLLESYQQILLDKVNLNSSLMEEENDTTHQDDMNNKEEEEEVGHTLNELETVMAAYPSIKSTFVIKTIYYLRILDEIGISTKKMEETRTMLFTETVLVGKSPYVESNIILQMGLIVHRMELLTPCYILDDLNDVDKSYGVRKKEDNILAPDFMGISEFYSQQFGVPYSLDEEFRKLLHLTKSIGFYLINLNQIPGGGDGTHFMHEVIFDLHSVMLTTISATNSIAHLKENLDEFRDLVHYLLTLLQQIHFWVEETSTTMFNVGCILSIYKLCVACEHLIENFRKQTSSLYEIRSVGISILHKISLRSGLGLVLFNRLLHEKYNFPSSPSQYQSSTPLSDSSTSSSLCDVVQQTSLLEIEKKKPKTNS